METPMEVSLISIWGGSSNKMSDSCKVSMRALGRLIQQGVLMHLLGEEAFPGNPGPVLLDLGINRRAEQAEGRGVLGS